MKTNVIKKVSSIIFISIIFFANYATASNFSEARKEERKVDDFKEIVLAIPADLFISQGDNNEVIIEADDNVLEKINTEVRNGKLIIEFEKRYNYRGFSKIKIYVSMPEIEKLSLTGSGRIISNSPIKAEKIGFLLSGSGLIEIDELVAGKVGVMITGSGDIKVKGKTKANYLDATITGSGDFESVNLTFDKANLTITGSGSMNTSIVDELNAVITGSGKIYYQGNPLIDARITGSGKISNRN